MSALHELFEHTSDAIFGIDENRNIRFWNKSCEGLMGLTHQQAIGKPCADLLNCKDIQGNDICTNECPIAKAANVLASNSDYELVLKSAGNKSVLVNVGSYFISKLYQKNNNDIQVFHSMRQINCQ